LPFSITRRRDFVFVNYSRFELLPKTPDAGLPRYACAAGDKTGADTAINKNLLFLIFTSLDDKVIIIKDECFQFVAV
jgi:hypothetical protein